MSVLQLLFQHLAGCRSNNSGAASCNSKLLAGCTHAAALELLAFQHVGIVL
jgi:hypothetical protein